VTGNYLNIFLNHGLNGLGGFHGFVRDSLNFDFYEQRILGL